MESTSLLLKSVSRRVWSPPQRPFRVCCHDRVTKKGITARTLEELREKVCQALLLSLSAMSLSLVCEEDGTEVNSEEFLMSLPDNTVLMALEPEQTWRPAKGAVTIKQLHDAKPRTGKDIARVTFDLYRLNSKDLFGSLNVKATFRGLYSVSADFKCLGPKKLIREALRVASTLLQAAGQMLISSASIIRRIIEGAEIWHTPRPQAADYWD